MNTSRPHSALFTPLAWDPGLLPPLEMDGYLTGVLVMPKLNLADWIYGLWTTMPPVTDRARIKQAFAAALARIKMLEAELQKGWPSYQPSFCAKGQKADHDKVRAWMAGFYKAMQLQPEYWSDLAENERTATFLGLLVGFIDLGEQIEEREDADQIRDEHAELLPRAIVAMRKLALLHDGDAKAIRSIEANKVGRNDPCPCGSGKKYKHCCPV